MAAGYGGPRPNSGRKRGYKTPETLAKQAEAEMQAALASKRKLGMDMLHEWAMAFGALAAKHQPVDGNTHSNEAKFEKWAKLSMEAAALKAPYETPRLKAIAVQRVPEESVVPPAGTTIDHVADAITPQEAYRIAMNAPPESAEIVPLKKKRRA